MEKGVTTLIIESSIVYQYRHPYLFSKSVLGLVHTYNLRGCYSLLFLSSLIRALPLAALNSLQGCYFPLPAAASSIKALIPRTHLLASAGLHLTTTSPLLSRTTLREGDCFRICCCELFPEIACGSETGRGGSEGAKLPKVRRVVWQNLELFCDDVAAATVHRLDQEAPAPSSPLEPQAGL